MCFGDGGAHCIWRLRYRREGDGALRNLSMWADALVPKDQLSRLRDAILERAGLTREARPLRWFDRGWEQE